MYVYISEEFTVKDIVKRFLLNKDLSICTSKVEVNRFYTNFIKWTESVIIGVNQNESYNDRIIVTNDRRYVYSGYTEKEFKKNFIKSIEDILNDENKYFKCSECGRIHHAQNRKWTPDNKPLCYGCFNRSYFVCTCCNETFELSEAINTTSGKVCRDCVSEYFVACADCGDLIHRSDYYEVSGLYYCYNCHENMLKVIKHYGYKPRPKFYGKNTKRFLGIELEIDDLNNRISFSNEVSKELGSIIYIKTDGSLSERGVEIVSHPCSIDYFKKEFKFEKIKEIAEKYNGKSHNTSTCGFHVHVSNDYFDSYELSASKLLFINEKFWDQIVKFSRRDTFSYCQKNPKNKINKKEVLSVKEKAMNNGRYYAINLCNENTIEFRIFRGSLRPETLLASLELVDFMCVIANTLSIMELQKMTWDCFIKKAKEFNYKHLIKYCERRNICA